MLKRALGSTPGYLIDGDHPSFFTAGGALIKLFPILLFLLGAAGRRETVMTGNY